MNTPVNPSFTILKWSVREYKSRGHVILMVCVGCIPGFLIVETIGNVSNSFYATGAFIKVAVSRGSTVYEIVLDTYCRRKLQSTNKWRYHYTQ